LGAAAVFAGRLVPGVRTLISIPAGITAMSLGRFMIWTTLGTTLWTAFLAGMGYVLEDRYQTVAQWANPISNLIVGVLALVYIYRLITFRDDDPNGLRDRR
jgi:membrane protein DedA with SNARE-associated domain